MSSKLSQPLTIIQRPAYPGNYTANRNSQRVSLIVCHIMDGTLEGTAAWYANPKAKVSAHYGVGKTGTIHQYVSDDHSAWHAGVIETPLWPHLRRYSNGGALINPNAYSIGIEFEGRRNDVFTDAQYAAGAKLIARLCARHSITLGPSTICRHSDISPKSRPGSCPGPGCDLNRLIAEANAILAQA